jgi:hypothetical protein
MPDMEQIGPVAKHVTTNDYLSVFCVSDARGSDDGAGTADKPLKSLDAALAKAADAAADRRYAILVEEGDYHTVKLALKPFVHVYGSFVGSDWKQRDVIAHASVLNADGQGPVVIAADQDRLDGFKITGGMNDGSGGAIVCRGGSGIISNNVIVDNRTIHTPEIKPETLHMIGHEGGAIAVLEGASPRIVNNLIYNNTTDVGDGGAIVVRDGSNPTISKNVIVANKTGLTDTTMYDGKVGSRSSNGAGISVSDTCAPEISQNVIVLNKAHNTSDGGGIYVEYEATPHITRNWLVGNTTSDDGGAIYVRGLPDNSPAKGKGPLIDNNIFAGNRVFHNMRMLDRFDEAIFISKSGRATIRHNLFTGQGSAVGNANSIMTLEDNLIVKNLGVGVYVDLRVEKVPLSTVTGNIFWGNADKQYTTVRTLSPVPIVTNNIIQGGYEGEGNRNVDPQFVDDSISAKITGRTFELAPCLTAITVDKPLPKESQAGRLVNVGHQWSVIRSSDEKHLIVWGEISDQSRALFIAGTFRQQM